MPQLTFDEFKEPQSLAPDASREAAWYKGRTLSHSSVSTYQQCPQKWKFRYIDKIPEKPRSFFSFGKSVHTGLEFLFARLPAAVPSLDEMLAHYKTHWFRDGYESAAQEKWFFQEGERILRGFYAKHQKDFSKVLHVELKFTVDIGGVPVTGYIDRIDAAEGGLAIIDYKTGKAFDKARVRTDSQLTLYQIACREMLGREVKSVTLYHLNSFTPITVPAHPRSLEEQVRAGVVEAARGIQENKFDPKPEPNGYCQWCDYAQICPGLNGKNRPPAAPAFAQEPVESLVDRYAKLDKRAKELNEERERLKQSLLLHLNESGATRLDGKLFSLCLLSNTDGGEPALDVQPKGPLPS